jgi:Tfp pilus assembly protein PilF
VGRTSLNLLPIGIALVIAAGGCNLGPNAYDSGTDLQRGRIGSASRVDGPDGGLSVATDQGHLPGDVSPSSDVRSLVHYDGQGPGAVRQTSGVFGGSEAVKSISSSIKEGFHKVSDMFTPATPPKPADDAISLSNQPKPSARLYVAMARLAERSGKVGDAERHYQRALRLEPRHAGALVGYARFKDRQGKLDEAAQIYQQAAQASPKDASILNDLGLCFARRGLLGQSRAALEGAIRLEPNKELYRNNIAMVLVEMGDVDAALAHLRAVQSEAVAYYRVGYILEKRGDSEAAAGFFAKALQKNPSFAAAQLWLEEIRRRPAAGSPSAPQVAKDPRSGPGPTTAPGQPALRRQAVSPGGRPMAPLPAGNARPPAETTRVRQLPPVYQRPSAKAPQLRPVPGQTPGSQAAPLPPTTSSSRPIPGGQPSRSGIPVVHPLPPVADAARPSP